MRRPACAPVAGLFATFAACASLACGGPEFVAGPGSTGDDGGQTQGPDATTPPSDGGSGGSDSSVTDGQVGPTDGGTKKHDGGDASTGPGPGDGGSGGDAGDGGPLAFACPSPDTTVVFCSDFDESTTAPWEWSAPVVTMPKGNDTVDTTDYLTSPNGFAASTEALIMGDTYTLASLQKTFSSLQGRIDYTFHMYVKTYDTLDNPTLPVAQLIVGPQTTGALTLELALKAGQMQLVQSFTGADGGEQDSTINVGAVASGQWVAVDLLLDRSTTSWTVTVLVTGGAKLLVEPPITPSNQNLEVDLGIIGLLPVSTPNAITFDNVTVRAY